MDNIQECPICACKEIGIGKLWGQGGMLPMHFSWTGSLIIADICTDCGHILSLKVTKPELFKSKK